MQREREQIEKLCERFKDRLGDQLSENYRKQPFFPHGTAQEVFRNHKRDLQRLLQNVSEALAADETLLLSVADQTRRSLSNVLAIVLRDRARNDTLGLNQFLSLILQRNNHMRETLELSDSELPISRARAEHLFPGKGDAFFTTQLQFCAIVLQDKKELNCSDNEQILRPLPYLRQENIGSGGFGQVWEVKIERHHMLSANGDSENRDPVLLARKDFQIQAAFKKELEVLREIMKQPQKHDHLVPLLAILQQEAIYSLFFPLASCDLSAYFDQAPVPRDLDEKKTIYHRGVALAGALAFLHHGLTNMSCYHLDLKPKNILVYHEGTPDEVWKIADFGLSSVRVNATLQSNGDSTMATGVPGTYLAPECAVIGGMVSALSDVWSFGCIFSLVLTFMMEGGDGIEKFKNRRGKEPNGDTFYTDPAKPQVSPAVTKWFDHLKELASKDPCSKVICESLDFLLGHVLLPRRKQRLEARKIEARLKEIWTNNSHFESPSIANDRSIDHSSSIWTRLRSRASRPTPPTLAVRGSRFSPEGNILVSYNDSQNLIHQNLIQELPHMPRPVVVQIPGSVNCVSVSNNYICNGLKGNCFTCCIYSTGDSINKQPDPISLPNLGSIEMVALSTDGALVAFIIFQEPGGTEMECLRYLCKTEDLMRQGDGGYPSPISSRLNSAASAPSLGSISTRSAVNRVGPAIGLADNIRFFGFTSDDQFLVMVTQEQTISFRVKAWKTQGATLDRDTPWSEMTIPYKGSVATTAAQFTACTVFVLDGSLHLFILSQEQYLINADLSGKKWKSRELNKKMVHIHHSNDNRTLIFLKPDRQQIFTLAVSKVLIDDVPIAHLTPKGTAENNPTRTGQANLVLRSKERGQEQVLLATADGLVHIFDVT